MSVVVTLDDASDARVRQCWQSLDAAGISSVAAGPAPPHVTLTAFDPSQVDTDGLLDSLARSSGPIALTMAAVGFFLTEESVAFLAVTPTVSLLELHREAQRLVEGHQGDARLTHVHSDRWLPHCTLAVGVQDQSAVCRTVTDEVPVGAVAGGLALLDGSTGRIVHAVAGGWSGLPGR